MGDWSFDRDRGVVGQWPRDARGEYERPAFLEHVFGSEPELALERNMLLSFGVPTVCRYPLDGTLGKVVLGMSGTGMEIFVPESMLEDARNIISYNANDESINEINHEEE